MYIRTNILMLALQYSYKIISQALKVLQKHQIHLCHSTYEVSYYNVPVQTLKTLNIFHLICTYMHYVSRFLSKALWYQFLKQLFVAFVDTLVLRYYNNKKLAFALLLKQINLCIEIENTQNHKSSPSKLVVCFAILNTCYLYNIPTFNSPISTNAS